jgi:hypothetical protein
MDRKLWTAVQELIEAANYAVGVLDRYADFQDDEGGVTQSPNPPLRALTDLENTATAVERLMPENPETSLETAIARAEYEEDR